MRQPYRITKELFAPELINEFENKRDQGVSIDWSEVSNKPQLADQHWRSPVATYTELPLVGNLEEDIRLVLDENAVYSWHSGEWELIGANDTNIEWSHVQGKPSTFPPSIHTHSFNSLEDVPTVFPPSTHTHPEAQIVGLDKYTKQEVDTIAATKAASGHTHSELHAHSNKAIIDTITQTDLNTWNTVDSKADATATQSALDGKAPAVHDHDGRYHTKTEMTSLLGGKANTVHTHTIANVTDLQTALDDKVNNNQVLTNVPAGALFTDTIYTHPANHPASIITQTTTARFVTDAEKTAWNAKWDYNEATIKGVKVNSAINSDTVNGLTVQTAVPIGAVFTDTVYDHPLTHPASMIVESITQRFVSDDEKADWNAKWDYDDLAIKSVKVDNAVNADTVNNLTVLTAVPTGALFTDTVYTHPETHAATMIVEDIAHRFVTDAEKTAWNAKWDYDASEITNVKVDNAGNADTVNNLTVNTAVPVGALFTDTVYTHPANHPASIITQTTTARFVTDTEKATWNAKSNLALGTTSTTAYRGDHGLVAYNHSQAAHAPTDAPSNTVFTTHTNDSVAHTTAAEKNVWNAKQDDIGSGTTAQYLRGDGAWATPTNTTYALITEAAILAGTETTSRVVSGARLKYAFDNLKAGSAAQADSVAWGNVTGKPSTYPPSTHEHDQYLTAEDISGLGGGDMVKATYDTNNSGVVDSAEAVAWVNVTDKPSTFTPTAHTHTIANVTNLQTSLDGKVNTAQVLTNVPAGAVFTDTVYTHPVNHPPSIITQDASNRFVTDAEKTTWNGKSNLVIGTTSSTAHRGDHGVVAYNHSQVAHAPSDANNYTHPDSHPASIITQTTTARFVTDTEKTTWNNKSNLALGTTSTTAHRGDHGVVAYNHSQAAHAPAQIYHVGTTAPADTNRLWIDTSG